MMTDIFNITNLIANTLYRIFCTKQGGALELSLYVTTVGGRNIQTLSIKYIP